MKLQGGPQMLRGLKKRQVEDFNYGILCSFRQYSQERRFFNLF